MNGKEILKILNLELDEFSEYEIYANDSSIIITTSKIKKLILKQKHL